MPDLPPLPRILRLGVSKQEINPGLSRVLHRLIIDGGVSASDVVVLTPHSAAHATVRGRVGAFTVTADPIGEQDVRLESIHRFKGLDARAVVICEVDRFVEEEFTRLMYVGCSRARAFLSVLVTEG